MSGASSDPAARSFSPLPPSFSGKPTCSAVAQRRREARPENPRYAPQSDRTNSSADPTGTPGARSRMTPLMVRGRRRLWGETVVRVWGPTRRTPIPSMTSVKDLGETRAPNRRGKRRPWNRAREARTPHSRVAATRLSRTRGPFACFWLFVIPRISAGFSIIRGGRPDQRWFDAFADPLLAAEATLASALWREACRRLGCNPKLAKLSNSPRPPISPSWPASVLTWTRRRTSHAHQRSRPAGCIVAGLAAAPVSLRIVRR
jgi:hypothetical protein